MTVKHWNTGASATRFRNQQKEKMTPIINGTYKKDNPDEEIGYQKWEVRKTYEVDVLYTIVTKTKKEAEELLERRETPEQEVDDYGDTFMETIKSKFTSDLSGDEPTTWKKVEECIPSEDTNSDNDFKPFINYESGTWSTDDYEWLKNEDGTDIKEVKDER
jgi:hypothetical protein